MVLNCNVKGCRKNSGNDTNHSFFRLPKNPVTFEKWLAFAGFSHNRTHIRICSDHFDQEMFRKRYPRPLLVRDAVPTIRVLQTPSSNCNNRRILGDHSCATDQQKFACETLPEKASPPLTQIINIHANNVSSIIISGKDKKVIVNIINSEANENMFSA